MADSPSPQTLLRLTRKFGAPGASLHDLTNDVMAFRRTPPADRFPDAFQKSRDVLMIQLYYRGDNQKLVHNMAATLLGGAYPNAVLQLNDGCDLSQCALLVDFLLGVPDDAVDCMVPAQ